MTYRKNGLTDRHNPPKADKLLQGDYQIDVVHWSFMMFEKQLKKSIRNSKIVSDQTNNERRSLSSTIGSVCNHTCAIEKKGL